MSELFLYADLQFFNIYPPLGLEGWGKKFQSHIRNQRV